MKSIVRYILSLMMSIMGIVVNAAVLDWVDNSTNKTCIVSIPSALSWNLPSNDTYEIGYFIYQAGNYSCVGKTIIKLGQELSINIGVNNGSGLGYLPGDRFITFVRNTNFPSQEYAVEFRYWDERKTCQPGQASIVESIEAALWNWPSNVPTAYCNSDMPFDIVIPYGLQIKNLTISAGTSFVNHGDNSFTIQPESMEEGSYSFSFTPLAGIANDTVYNYQIKKFPINLLNQNYEICENEVVIIKKVDSVNKVVRSLVSPNSKFIIDSPGKYIYGILDLSSGCQSFDTVSVVKGVACQMSSIVINPSNKDELYFNDDETIEVLDINLKKITTISAPAKWGGTDNNNKPLPMGLYILIHADKSVQYVTVVY